MNIQEDNTEERGAKNHEQTVVEMLQAPNEITENRGGEYQSPLEPSSEGMEPAKGLMKKKPATNSEVKGAHASRKLLAHRGHSSPKKSKGTGTRLGNVVADTLAKSSLGLLVTSPDGE
ncbi:hypothetical protein F2Q70_00017023 [Brassica cretica]|uniref:Uncharacterized protein n=1 Tax=Brassica cretica TaxID=69181 RepID=A0A8S9I0Q6_BRACR|nr:hypothetical protein F2Q70_00017023 [Brassica cretica]